MLSFYWYNSRDSESHIKIVWVDNSKEDEYEIGQFIVFYLSDWNSDVREFVTHQTLSEFLYFYDELYPIGSLPDFLEENRSFLHPREYYRLVEKFV